MILLAEEDTASPKNQSKVQMLAAHTFDPRLIWDLQEQNNEHG